MAVFAVIASRNPDAVKQAVNVQYGANHYEFDQNVWFVSDAGTTKDVADKLGILGGKLEAWAVVLRFEGYAGFASKAGWRWLDAFPEVISNG